MHKCKHNTYCRSQNNWDWPNGFQLIFVPLYYLVAWFPIILQSPVTVYLWKHIYACLRTCANVSLCANKFRCCIHMQEHVCMDNFTCAHAYMYVCIVCSHTYIYACIHACLCISAHVFLGIRPCSSMIKSNVAYIHKNIWECTGLLMRICMYECMHAMYVCMYLCVQECFRTFLQICFSEIIHPDLRHICKNIYVCA
jgi:hypothetical protein